MDQIERPETRLYVACDLMEGDRIALSVAQAHQLKTVQRLTAGNVIALFNGRDGEWVGRLAFDRKSAEVELLRISRPQAEPSGLWLLFAPIKHGRIDFLVEKAAELGVARLIPVMTERTQVARVNTARLRETAREAAEQCGRLDVPEVAEPVKLAAALQEWDRTRPLYVCAESGAAVPAWKAFSDFILPSPSGRGEGEGLSGGGPSPSPVRSATGRPLPQGEVVSAAILIGPEGGFSPTEFAMLRALPFVAPVSLGPRILRAETAALAALACWQAVAGEWRDRR